MALSYAATHHYPPTFWPPPLPQASRSTHRSPTATSRSMTPRWSRRASSTSAPRATSPSSTPRPSPWVCSWSEIRRAGTPPLRRPRLSASRRSRCAGRRGWTSPSSPFTSACVRSASPPRSSPPPRSPACTPSCRIPFFMARPRRHRLRPAGPPEGFLSHSPSARSRPRLLRAPASSGQPAAWAPPAAPAATTGLAPRPRRSNLDAVQQSLSDKEEATLARLQSEVFGPAGQQSWEGVELAAYWQVVGKSMMAERLYNKPKL
jgi:hypothetical protein